MLYIAQIRAMTIRIRIMIVDFFVVLMKDAILKMEIAQDLIGAETRNELIEDLESVRRDILSIIEELEK